VMEGEVVKVKWDYRQQISQFFERLYSAMVWNVPLVITFPHLSPILVFIHCGRDLPELRERSGSVDPMVYTYCSALLQVDRAVKSRRRYVSDNSELLWTRNTASTYRVSENRKQIHIRCSVSYNHSPTECWQFITQSTIQNVKQMQIGSKDHCEC
jgi:hypothetical protein